MDWRDICDSDGPLDMLMSGEGMSAADFLNTAEEREISDVLVHYGEEHQARRIAKAIVQARPLSRTLELADLVADVLGPAAKRHPIHPATRTFQALRIHVNDELGELTRALEAATAILAPAGRLAVVSFHSLEDRIVKRFLTERGKPVAQPSRHTPQAAAIVKPQYRLVNSKPRIPDEVEIHANPRARSAKLRAAERLAA